MDMSFLDEPYADEALEQILQEEIDARRQNSERGLLSRLGGQAMETIIWGAYGALFSGKRTPSGILHGALEGNLVSAPLRLYAEIVALSKPSEERVRRAGALYLMLLMNPAPYGAAVTVISAGAAGAGAYLLNRVLGTSIPVGKAVAIGALSGATETAVTYRRAEQLREQVIERAQVLAASAPSPVTLGDDEFPEGLE